MDLETIYKEEGRRIAQGAYKWMHSQWKGNLTLAVHSTSSLIAILEHALAGLKKLKEKEDEKGKH